MYKMISILLVAGFLFPSLALAYRSEVDTDWWQQYQEEQAERYQRQLEEQYRLQEEAWLRAQEQSRLDEEIFGRKDWY